MKRSILRALALCLTTVCAVDIASAQDDTTTRSRTGRAGQTTPGSSGLYGSSISSSTRSGQPVRASKLMNSSLKNQTGESLGTIQDIVIDPASGQVQFAVISLSSAGTGTPGTITSPSTTTSAGQLVAIPLAMVTPAGEGQFVTMIDRSTLQSAPTFTSSAWPNMDSAWSQRINSHFGVTTRGTATGAPGSGTGSGTGTGTGTTPGNPTTPGLPSTPGTPDITPPSGTSPTPGTTSGSGTGTSPGGAGGAGSGK